jgi:ABC-type spermidine/putrescine transport system permease subunit I
MVLSIASALEGIDGALEDAAMTLGATPAKTFLHVVLPLSREGVVTGTLLVFALCTGSFVTVMLMGSNATMVLPLLVYQQLNVASDWPFAAALGTILILVVVAATVIQLAFARQRGRA